MMSDSVDFDVLGTPAETPAETRAVTASDDDEDDEQDEPEAKKAEPKEEPKPDKVKLKVNHKDVEVTQDELVAAAQKHYAAEDRLALATKKEKEAKTLMSAVGEAVNVIRNA